LTGPELRALMTRHGITVQALADVIGKSNRMIDHYRSGKHEIPRLLVILMAAIDAKAIDTDWLEGFLESESK
jgi:transcriptional regulator with XRE-family HTH domain